MKRGKGGRKIMKKLLESSFRKFDDIKIRTAQKY